ncbi:MAG: DNA polymerase III subunit gamma/tau [Oscillospiraceae bacterium]|nr:DNA polymerase III subunit gamma/tau [Oscillospiraceae bacterium]
MYQALYRKYRPQTFDDVVGQESITQILRTQVVTGKLSHAYLFTGSRGTGKTTCSKILAKAVNCLNPVQGNPCNCCEACRAIDSGACMDVLEIDAASNNGVDNVRSLREDAVYAPAQVKKRVYIIDEVHMLSLSAFNALLKIIEEPPAHLMFILATTELHKVPATILSRCQRFSFRRIDPEAIAARIHYVAYEEGIELSDEAANLLGRLADGALRDGLSLLDQCAAAAQGPVTAETVYAALGIAGARTAGEILRAVSARDSGKALTLFTRQYAEGKDLGALVDELVSLCRDLLLLKTAPKAGASMLSGVCTDAELQALLGCFTAQELLRHTRLLQDTASGFNRSANRRVDVELCLLQMCDPGLSLDAEAINARLSRVEAVLASGVLPAPAREPEGEAPARDGTEAPPPSDRDAPPSPREEPPAAPAPDSGGEELPVSFWADLIRAVQRWRPSLASYFNNNDARFLSPALRGDLLELTAASDYVKSLVDREDIRDYVAQQASALLRRPVRVRFVLRGTAPAESEGVRRLMEKGRQYPGLFHITE